MSSERSLVSAIEDIFSQQSKEGLTDQQLQIIYDLTDKQKSELFEVLHGLKAAAEPKDLLFLGAKPTVLSGKIKLETGFELRFPGFRWSLRFSWNRMGKCVTKTSIRANPDDPEPG